MFRDLVLNLRFACWFIVPVVVSIVLLVLQVTAWRKAVQKKAITLKSETFGGAINMSLTVSSVVFPLASLYLAYLLTATRLPPTALAPLIAGVLLVFIAVLVGLWNAYSLPFGSWDGDSIEIAKDRNITWPAFFVGQFSLLASGLVVLVLSFLLIPGVDRTRTASPGSGASFALVRPAVRVGATRTDVEAQWGGPDERELGPGGVVREYRYHSPTTEYRIVFEGDTVVSFTEQRPHGGVAR